MEEQSDDRAVAVDHVELAEEAEEEDDQAVEEEDENKLDIEKLYGLSKCCNHRSR